MTSGSDNMDVYEVDCDKCGGLGRTIFTTRKNVSSSIESKLIRDINTLSKYGTIVHDNSHDKHVEFLSLDYLDEFLEKYCENETPYERVIAMDFVNRLKENVRNRIKQQRT